MPAKPPVDAAKAGEFQDKKITRVSTCQKHGKVNLFVYVLSCQEQRPLLPVGVTLDKSLEDQVKSMAENMPMDGDLVAKQNKAHLYPEEYVVPFNKMKQIQIQ